MANRFKLRKSWRRERSSSGGWAAECVRSGDSCGPGVRDGVRDGQWGCGVKGSVWDVTHHESETEVAHSCPTLCDPMDGSLPGLSIHGISQARVLEWGPGDLPDPWIEPGSPALQADALPSGPPGALNR